jgi:hypothetical protein
MTAPEVSAELEGIVLRAMERDPLHRYRSARELAWDLGHQDQLAVKTADEGGTPQNHLAAQGSRVFPYWLLGLIPIVIMVLLLYVAAHN